MIQNNDLPTIVARAWIEVGVLYWEGGGVRGAAVCWGGRGVAGVGASFAAGATDRQSWTPNERFKAGLLTRFILLVVGEA
jgi:hypothetical protein